ncbi:MULTISPECIES: methylated-DNA--[protein]-cysteine S-methyltransferase [unclassified Variovorax]|uniref:methylated-DNA--[protein]-cysteine S-methyltransferase n=1 Tax=unclassified Variovorax TaxID=663243 RepID=UPI000F7F6A42|nr:MULTISPECIES: methylated-DNA--[protein]-cysteine S-methyltransferase [unclassified Variovorax]RSZ32643.1 methylated-DNA--[protein]-cysteine S-methyltransferase [Variovorax sp. 553]RSZ33121.1 methylated-DNA--[protein]-cysteine S-methyltransferase [Variovorax sp. 679]
MKLQLSRLDSPLGELLLVTDTAGALHALDFADHRARLHRLLRQLHDDEVELSEGAAPQALADAIGRYFDGDLAAIEALPVATLGDALQQKVWAALRRIPAGRTTSYGELAKQLGLDDPRAAVDVGAANGSNPISIVVPCHRVIGKNGDLKGYAGGVFRKQRLLQHEGALPAVDAKPAGRVEKSATMLLPF